MNHLVKIAVIAIACSVLFASSNVQFSHPATTDSKTISMQGQILPPPSGVVYWKADFEEGNFNDLTGGGTPQTEGSGGLCSIVTSPVFKGTYAFKGAVVTPPSSGIVNAKAIRWSPFRGTQNQNDGIQELYFGAALWLSPGFVGKDWGVNIMQLHVMSDNGMALPAVLLVTGSSTGTLRFQLYSKDWQNGEHTWWTGTTGAVPIGQWFTAVIYWDGRTSSGTLKLWINGILMTTATGDFMVGANSVDPSGWSGPFLDAGIYQSSLNPAQYVVVDEMIVASTLSAATP